MDAAFPVGDGDDLRALLGHQLRGDRADVAEALHGDARALELEPEMLRGFARDDHHAAARRLAPPERPAHLDRLAGDDRRRGVADVHRVGVHDPRHDLFVGVDVGRRHVLVGADRVDDLGGVAARQRFELALRHLGRIANDAALAAAERQLRDGALPRHPRRERRHFVERDVRVIADAALGRAERDVVLHAIAGEDLDLAVVHLHGAGHDDLALGLGEDLPDAGFEIENAGGDLELLEHRREQRTVCGHQILAADSVDRSCGRSRDKSKRSKVAVLRIMSIRYLCHDFLVSMTDIESRAPIGPKNQGRSYNRR